ncbi:fluoride efflux transporter FluC [Lacticaseibacillus baoqingensis]|uniref:Fluoride-specific ion channel FluC n=1 Tax=Lacticaseibacillus baoqingensis TaxID=2486013 RepID=A0ABW4E991_9LACO|nr:CrcB family protein [Lacticaseibacillus baoqingensis]
MQELKQLPAVFGGGMLGGLARYGIGILLPANQGLLAATVVNLAGSFGLALLTFGLAARLQLPTWLTLGLGTGFIGAFTTWSTLVLLTVTHGAWLWLLGELIGGVIAAGAGFWLGQAVLKQARQW